MIGIRLFGRLRGCTKDNLILFLLAAFASLLLGCSSAYYGTMEKLGYPKRDLMVNRVESARDAQQDAKEEFQSALEKFKTVVKFEGGTLEEKYDELKSAYAPLRLHCMRKTC